LVNLRLVVILISSIAASLGSTRRNSQLLSSTELTQGNSQVNFLSPTQLRQNEFLLLFLFLFCNDGERLERLEEHVDVGCLTLDVLTEEVILPPLID